ncbi:MAG TPA: DUF2179 domain-containing protein [Gemmataceae bacterium]|jgi:uncharacterized protein YebE (UPF0316 family)|nr:DUF2179 domain-containing protein [Gemmataceae bacterium]
MPLLFGFTMPLLPGLPLPVLIFLAEMCVVTLGTIRIIFVARGMKGLASGLGFFEVSTWLFAIGQIMQNLTDLSCYAAFAGGFTVGNFCGILIEKRLAIGTQVVRIITKKDAAGLIEGLRSAGYGVTSLEGRGATGPVQIVFTVIKRKQLADVVAIIKRFDPRAFYSIDDVQAAAAGVFPAASKGTREVIPGILRLRRAA